MTGLVSCLQCGEQLELELATHELLRAPSAPRSRCTATITTCSSGYRKAAICWPSRRSRRTLRRRSCSAMLGLRTRRRPNRRRRPPSGVPRRRGSAVFGGGRSACRPAVYADVSRVQRAVGCAARHHGLLVDRNRRVGRARVGRRARVGVGVRLVRKRDPRAQPRSAAVVSADGRRVSDFFANLAARVHKPVEGAVLPRLPSRFESPERGSRQCLTRSLKCERSRNPGAGAKPARPAAGDRCCRTDFFACDGESARCQGAIEVGASERPFNHRFHRRDIGGERTGARTGSAGPRRRRNSRTSRRTHAFRAKRRPRRRFAPADTCEDAARACRRARARRPCASGGGARAKARGTQERERRKPRAAHSRGRSTRTRDRSQRRPRRCFAKRFLDRTARRARSARTIGIRHRPAVGGAVVHVSIGRIEVRAATQSAERRRESTPSAVMSLAEYLSSRAERAR